jgi:hypothetical protein
MDGRMGRVFLSFVLSLLRCLGGIVARMDGAHGAGAF